MLILQNQQRGGGDQQGPVMTRGAGLGCCSGSDRSARTTHTASKAMQALNGADFDGRPLKVNEAQERERSGGGGGPRGGGSRGGGPRRY